ELAPGIVSDLSDFTISAWVNLRNAPTWSRIFDFGDNRGQWLFHTPSSNHGKPRFEVSTVYGYNAQRVDYDLDLPLKRWTHVAVTLSGKQATLYIDGKEAGTNSAIDFPPHQMGDTPRNWIGRSQHENDP